jgi:hypothetical protein
MTKWAVLFFIGLIVMFSSIALLLYGQIRYAQIVTEYSFAKATNQTLPIETMLNMTNEMLGVWYRLPILAIVGFTGALTSVVSYIIGAN